MTDNDMFVVFYKILSYLYESLKAGKRPNWADLQYNSSLLNIPEGYWKTIMQELVEEGYVKGLKIVETKSGPVYCDNGIYITGKGVEFLETNSLMGKTKEFLNNSFQTVLGALVSVLADQK